MHNNHLQKLLVEQLADLYDAEKQLVKALPKMAKAASDSDLIEAFQNHLSETQNQVTRLEEVFQSLGAPAKGKTCKAMKGLIEEGSEALEKKKKGSLRDLAMIASAQRVEHYEISAYGTLRAIAEVMDESKAVKLLEKNEEEEVEADSLLTEIALRLYKADFEEAMTA
jgi:ferritin-like metal-binding protein YciE